MAHYPLNHRLRPAYRLVAFLAALYLLVFGVVGLAATWGEPFLHRGSDWVLGLRTNPAAAWLATVVGLALVVAVVIGGNVQHHANLVVGWGLCGLAVVVMATIQTDANVLNAFMVNVLTLLVIGLLELTAGLYSKVGSAQAARAEDAAAHNPA